MKRTSLALAILAITMSSSAATADDDIDWTFTPYLWATTITAELNRPPVDNQSGFDDIIDKIDGAFLGHVEAQGDTWGMFGDLIFLGLGDDKEFERISTTSDLDTFIAELAVVYSPGDERWRGFELFGGIRYFDVSLEVELDPNNPALETLRVGPEESYADALAGARYTAALSDRWTFTARGDYSLGSTEGAFALSGLFGYQTSSGAWIAGYKYMGIELEAENDEEVELELYGPVVGYTFAF